MHLCCGRELRGVDERSGPRTATWFLSIVSKPSLVFSNDDRFTNEDLTESYPFICLILYDIESYSLGITPARNDRLTKATDGRSFPDKKENMSSRTSRLRLSAETMAVLGMDGHPEKKRFYAKSKREVTLNRQDL